MKAIYQAPLTIPVMQDFTLLGSPKDEDLNLPFIAIPLLAENWDSAQFQRVQWLNTATYNQHVHYTWTVAQGVIKV